MSESFANDAELICVCDFYGRVIWPEPAPMSDCIWCVCWWDGHDVRRTYLPDRPGAEAFAAARRGIIVMLMPDRPWPTRQDVIDAARNSD